MSKQQSNEPNKIRHYAERYSKFYVNLQKSTEIYVISGPQKAGKSVSVDLFTDKKLQQSENEVTKTMFVSEESNFNLNYDPIYFEFLESSNTLVIEGLTLSTQKNMDKLNLIKALFIKACLTSKKKISFIIIADSTERKQQESLHILLEDMFQCLNISDQGIIKEMSKHFYFLLTKTQEEDAIQQFQNICEDLCQEAQNKGVKTIIHDIGSNDKIRTFPNNESLQGLGKQLRSAFKPEEVTKKVFQYSSKNKLNQQMVMLLSQQNQQIIATFYSFFILAKTLAFNLLEKASNQKEFRAELAKFYKQIQSNKSKLGKQNSERILQDFKGTSWQGLKSIPNKQRITKQRIQKQKDKRAYELLIEYILTILKQLEAKALKKEGYRCLIGTLNFLKELSVCLDNNIVNDCIRKCMESFDYFEKFYEAGQALKKQQKVEPKITSGSTAQLNKGSKKPSQKKAVNKAANSFKQEILPSKNNEQAIQACINKIKEKEVLQNFEVNDVIYHLKFLRELLESYDSCPKVQNRHFIEQLLELYAYNENIYEFQTNVKKYVQKREIPLASIQRLIKKADEIKSYESQLRLINYLIANSFGDKQYRFLNQMKNMVRYKQHQQYLARSESKQIPTPEKKQYNLLPSLFDDIKQKADKEWLNSQSFKKLIQSSEE